MFLATLLGGCLVHWHWKASLISHLSVVIPHNPFSSLEELLLSSYQITILGSSSYQIDFEGAESGLFRDLWLTKFSLKFRRERIIFESILLSIKKMRFNLLKREKHLEPKHDLKTPIQDLIREF